MTEFPIVQKPVHWFDLQNKKISHKINMESGFSNIYRVQ